MENNKRSDWLLECLIHVVGRAAMKPEEISSIVDIGKNRIRAYNLCDGTLTQTQIAKKAHLDQGNFNRSVNRWVRSGIVFPFKEGKEVRFLHIFPIPAGSRRKSKSKIRRKSI
jgi:hypothetical protein